jgi:DNA polymerase-3 subunit delta'
MKFADIHGLASTKQQLIHSVRSNHVAHAQLFSGIEGSAILPMALAYATYLNCDNPGEHDACGSCPSCLKNEKFIHPDTHFVFPVSSTKNIVSKDAVSNTFLQPWRRFLSENAYGNIADWAIVYGGENKQAAISKQESRNIIESLSLKSFEGKYKIMLIWLPELMHPAAANGILKILEEPAGGTVFLLVSNQPDRLLTTIKSRTQLIRIPAFSDQELADILQNEFVIDPAKAAQIATMADGSLREARLLKDEVEEDTHGMFRSWMRLCFNNDFLSLTDFSEKFASLGKVSQKSMLIYGLNMLRESIIANFADGDLMRVLGDERTFATNFNTVITVDKVSEITANFSDAHYHLERNANAKILFMDLSIKIAKTFNK